MKEWLTCDMCEVSTHISKGSWSLISYIPEEYESITKSCMYFDYHAICNSNIICELCLKKFRDKIKLNRDRNLRERLKCLY